MWRFGPKSLSSLTERLTAESLSWGKRPVSAATVSMVTAETTARPPGARRRRAAFRMPAISFPPPPMKTREGLGRLDIFSEM